MARTYQQKRSQPEVNGSRQILTVSGRTTIFIFNFVISGRTTLNIERHCEVYTLTHLFFLRSYCSRDMMK